MGLFSFFSKFAFFKEQPVSKDVVIQEEDLDFDKWVKAHLLWRMRLSNLLNGTSNEDFDLTIVGCDDKCPLGQWIHGNGKKIYGRERLFTHLLMDHADFHKSAAHVIDVFQQKGLRQADILLRSEFDLASKRVIQDLQDLQKRVKGA